MDMAESINLKDLSLEELRKLHEDCTEDLIMFRKDLELFRQAHPGRITMVEEMYNPSHSGDTTESPAMKERDKATEKLIYRYTEMFTDIIITDISLTALDSDNSEQPFYQYNVTCSVGHINLELMYESNEEITEDRFKNVNESLYEIKNLKVNILSLKHKLELTETVAYYCANPTYIGALFLNFLKYDKMFSARRKVLKNLLVEYKEYLEISLDNETGQYVVECKGKYFTATLFILAWGIIFDIVTCSVRDSFKVDVYEEQQLLSDVKPTLKKLCNTQLDTTENERLRLLQNIMIAVKATDTRLDALSSVSSEATSSQKTS